MLSYIPRNNDKLNMYVWSNIKNDMVINESIYNRHWNTNFIAFRDINRYFTHNNETYVIDDPIVGNVMKLSDISYSHCFITPEHENSQFDIFRFKYQNIEFQYDLGWDSIQTTKRICNMLPNDEDAIYDAIKETGKLYTTTSNDSLFYISIGGKFVTNNSYFEYNELFTDNAPFPLLNGLKIGLKHNVWSCRPTNTIHSILKNITDEQSIEVFHVKPFINHSPDDIRIMLFCWSLGINADIKWDDVIDNKYIVITANHRIPIFAKSDTELHFILFLNSSESIINIRDNALVESIKNAKFNQIRGNA